MTGQRRAGVPPPALARLHPDTSSRPYWQAARAHRLVVAQCGSCGAFRFPPTRWCHVCRSQDITWTQVPGTGAVYTYTVVRHAVVPILAQAVPYVVAVIEIDGAPGARMVANIVGCDPADVEIGSRVVVEWDDIDHARAAGGSADDRELDDLVTIARFALIDDISLSER